MSEGNPFPPLRVALLRELLSEIESVLDVASDPEIGRSSAMRNRARRAIRPSTARFRTGTRADGPGQEEDCYYLPEPLWRGVRDPPGNRVGQEIGKERGFARGVFGEAAFEYPCQNAPRNR